MMTPGTITGEMTSASSAALPRNEARENETDASRPMMVEAVAATTPMMSEFQALLMNSRLLKKFSYHCSENDGGGNRPMILPAVERHQQGDEQRTDEKEDAHGEDAA
jgi:hypothetical protein